MVEQMHHMKKILKDSFSCLILVQSNNKPRITKWMVVALVTTLLGSCLPAGYCLGVINTPQEIIREWMRTAVLERYDKELSAEEEISLWAVVVSIFVGGAIIGASFGARLADGVGRRAALLLNHLLCFFSAVLLIWCKEFSSMEMLIIGRFTCGLYAGLATCLVPLYLSEVAPAEYKGVMGVTFPLGLCAGLLISQVLGMESILGTACGWPYLIGGFIVVVTIALLLHPILPESPTYCYVISMDDTKGLKELQRLRGDKKYIEVEVSSLRMLASAGSKTRHGKAWGLLRVLQSHGYRMSLMICITFNAGQQFSGINAVFFYSTLIFRTAGLDLHQSQIASIGAGIINFALSILAVPLIKHCKRRVLLLTSVALCILCQVVLMVALRLIPMSSYAPYVAIAALIFYVLVYGMGLGPVPFMIATELFPVGPRSVGLSLSGTTNWLSNLIVGITFPLIQEILGELSFMLFITSSCLLFIFIYRFLPETFGKEVMSLPHLSVEAQDNDEGISTGTEADSLEVRMGTHLYQVQL
ncbi:solute carrier family 2, facilitated glucose transporter member 3-like isoform X3 [Panulirus ornatus]|uniref:solute carrier family 2, facilitated glucose transporter member 3-like isoform X3 n=1 Tax=Panulirus ornatus TaxID=150431 RepID=UPI003A8720FD